MSLHSALQQIRVQSNPYGHSHIGCPQAHPLFLCTTFTEASCVDSFTLPNPDDRHVLAAALAGHAANVRDFPAAIVGAYGIEVVHPDRFIFNQWDLEPLVAIAAFRRMRARRKLPRTSVEDFAMALE
ncbi:hypothetical protein LJR267_009299 [Paraburkholderia hospita]|uniref:hypothetical protein n=1 Tax=Paraburkholderia hospita TaxID=169430 RepID=UPI003ECCAE75